MVVGSDPMVSETESDDVTGEFYRGNDVPTGLLEKFYVQTSRRDYL